MTSIRVTLTEAEALELLHVASGAMDDLASDEQADDEAVDTLGSAMTKLRKALHRRVSA